jgi:hypothetical protein
MTDHEALDILRVHGHATAIPDGWVRCEKPQELAEGKLSFDEICEPERTRHRSSAERPVPVKPDHSRAVPLCRYSDPFI